MDLLLKILREVKDKSDSIGIKQNIIIILLELLPSARLNEILDVFEGVIKDSCLQARVICLIYEALHSKPQSDGKNVLIRMLEIKFQKPKPFPLDARLAKNPCILWRTIKELL